MRVPSENFFGGDTEVLVLRLTNSFPLRHTCEFLAGTRAAGSQAMTAAKV